MLCYFSLPKLYGFKRPFMGSTTVRALWSLLALSVLFLSCDKNRAMHQLSTNHTEQHGPPKDWKFTLNQGDAAEGKRLFIEIQCYKCHEVKGEKFPDMAPDEQGVGPELSQMAGMHPLEFFVESIINPNAVIDADAKELGHVGPDGRSKMPEFAEILTVKQVTDLATYLASLRPRHQP